MGKKKNKKKNRKGGNKLRVQTPVNSIPLTPPQITNLTIDDTTKKKIEKKPWYKTGTAINIYVGLVIACIVGQYFYNKSSKDTQKSTTEIKEESKKNTNELKDFTKELFESGIKEMRGDSTLFQSLLKQQVSKNDYEKDKAIQNEKFKEYNRSNRKSTQKMINSAISKYNIVIKNINYVNGSRWSELFNAGYGIFTIGTDRKIYLYQGSFTSYIKLNWTKVKIATVTDTTIDIKLPEITDIQHYKKMEEFYYRMVRSYNNLNKIYFDNLFGYNIYYGIIADNENGIIGIIGFGTNSEDISNEKLIDFDTLQKLTHINFKENTYE